MKACILASPGPVESKPLRHAEIATPVPGDDEILVRVAACGICRTDLHVVEGELAPRRSPLVPGHQVVGVVETRGAEARRFAVGDRVGIAWLARTCGLCPFCRTGRENLCDAPAFTGWTVDGGYAEYATAAEAFAYPLPKGFGDLEAAPLLCAGIIGFRCLRKADVAAGARLGLFGFGAAAHVAIQVARHRGIDTYAVTREPKHQDLALRLGAVWAGASAADVPRRLDAAIVFAPSGALVPAALAILDKGGRLVLGGIHMSPTPPLDYSLLYQERTIQSVANNTREDGEEFLELAAEIRVATETTVYPLREANEALADLKHGRVSGAAVLSVERRS